MLNKAKQNNNTIKREALVRIFVVTNFRYLLASKFELHIEHHTLIYIVNKSFLARKMARWKLLLEEFDYLI